MASKKQSGSIGIVKGKTQRVKVPHIGPRPRSGGIINASALAIQRPSARKK